MHLVKLICFASVTYQACFVSPLSMVKPNEASQNCYIRSKRVRFNTPPISIWFCTRHLYCLQLENKFVYARKISLCSVGTSVAKEAPNFIASGIIERRYVKAGVNVKAVFTSLNTAFLPISRSRFKRRQIPMLITLSTIWQFCVNFWVIFRCFGKERFFLKG